MHRMRHLIFSSLLVVVLSAAGCGLSPDPSCADCTGCGIAGPVENPGKDIFLLQPGVTDGGTAAVDLALEDGECIASDRKTFRVSYIAGVVTVGSAEGLAKLDSTKVMDQGEMTRWSDRDLAMSSTRSGTTLVLAFVEAGKTVKVACDGANHVITCVTM